MSRIINFSAGPATLPVEVLEQIREELFDWRGIGASITEVSHHSKPYAELSEELMTLTRELLSIPADYEVLFLPLPARSQFAMIPMNLSPKGTAAYVETGLWSKQAIEEGRRYTQVNVAASAENHNGKTSILESGKWDVNPAADYCYYVSNETVDGVEFLSTPDVGDIPLVSDMTSSLFTEPLDIKRFGLIFAGAQKNFGVPALTLVILNKTLLKETLATTPTLFDYRVHIASQSRYCTPAVFACYTMLLMLQWIKRQGGVKKMDELKQQKAALLYQCIDGNDFYNNPVDASCRSRISVPFFLADEQLNPVFLEQAEKANLFYLKGHKAKGGMRASLYNGMPHQGVQALVDFMNDFARRFG